MYVCLLPSNNFDTFDFAVSFRFLCLNYSRIVYAVVTHSDFLYFCFVEQDSAHDRSPIRWPNNPRRNLRGNGRGLEGDGEEVFQELAMKLVNKTLQLCGKEITLCQQTDHLLHHRFVYHIDILQTVGREHFLCIVYR